MGVFQSAFAYANAGHLKVKVNLCYKVYNIKKSG